MSSLKLLFENARNIAILPHDSIDGDALCSSAALAEFAKSFGKRADIIFDDDIRKSQIFERSSFKKRRMYKEIRYRYSGGLRRR